MNQTTECQELKARAIFVAQEQQKIQDDEAFLRQKAELEDAYPKLSTTFPQLKKTLNNTFDLCGIECGIRDMGWDEYGKSVYALAPLKDWGCFIYDEASFGRYLISLEYRRVNPAHPKGFWASLFT